MLGIEIVLQAETGDDTTLAQGCIFPDGQVYIHEPICDCFASVDDMKLNLTVEHYEVIGPVVPLQRAKEALEATYKRQLAECKKIKRQLDQEYETSKQEIEQYEHMGKPTISIGYLDASGKWVDESDTWPEGETGCHVSKPTNVIHCTDILTDQEREFLQDLIKRKGLKILEIAQ